MCNQPNQVTPPTPAVPRPQPVIFQFADGHTEEVVVPPNPPPPAPPPAQQNVTDLLLHSRKFWIAVFAVVQTIVFAAVPGFPPAVWQAIAVLCGVLIASYAYNDGPGPA